MTSQQTDTTSLRPARVTDPEDVSEATNGIRRDLTAEQLARWARLVADGQETLPEGLDQRQSQEMIRQVRDLRRARLVNFIARQIALDIHRAAAAEHGGSKC